jgi:hypothetical protein
MHRGSIQIYRHPSRRFKAIASWKVLESSRMLLPDRKVEMFAPFSVRIGVLLAMAQGKVLSA